MKEIRRMSIPIEENKVWGWPPKSLVFQDDILVDWIGGARYRLNGETIAPFVAFTSYRFDSVKVSHCGEYIFIFERYGTKGVLIRKNAHIIRELNRSYYHADIYEYPFSFLTLPDGKTGIVHCPNEYCRLEIEDAETGELLTKRTNDSKDFFHSQLQVNENSTCLISSGWVWHPYNDCLLFDIPSALANPELLDKDTSELERLFPRTAAFIDNDTVITVSGDDDEEKSDIALYKISSKTLISKASIGEKIGIIYPLDSKYVLGFYEYPKLINIENGEIIARWPDLKVSKKEDSLRNFNEKDEEEPSYAVDVIKKRFAVASEGRITVIQLA